MERIKKVLSHFDKNFSCFRNFRFEYLRSLPAINMKVMHRYTTVRVTVMPQGQLHQKPVQLTVVPL